MLFTIYTFCETEGIKKSHFGDRISGLGKPHPGVKFSSPPAFVLPAS